jgi:hypothetical protein
MKTVRSLTASAAAVCLTLFLSTLCLAQSAPAPPAHSQVVITHVKSDMVNEWIDLQKNELIPAQKKGGIKTRTTYQTVFGNTNEYVTVVPFDKYAVFDGETPQIRALGAAASARLVAKLQKCTESRQVFISNAMPELSTAALADAPPIGVFTRVRVAPGKLPDYEAFVKTELLPIYKKLNAPLTTSRRGLGANANDVVSVAWVSKMADLDAGSPILRALGPAGVSKLLAKSGTMSTLVEQVVRRRVPDLSF